MSFVHCVFGWVHSVVNFIDQHVSNLSSPGHQDKLGVAETKLLHTLHWMLLEAAQECHQEPGLGHGWSGGSSGSSSAYLQPMGNQGLTDHNGSTTEENEYARAKLYHKNMATVELFVFLFAPLINRIKVGTFSVDIINLFFSLQGSTMMSCWHKASVKDFMEVAALPMKILHHWSCAFILMP